MREWIQIKETEAVGSRPKILAKQLDHSVIQGLQLLLKISVLLQAKAPLQTPLLHELLQRFET